MRHAALAREGHGGAATHIRLGVNRIALLLIEGADGGIVISGLILVAVNEGIILAVVHVVCRSVALGQGDVNRREILSFGLGRLSLGRIRLGRIRLGGLRFVGIGLTGIRFVGFGSIRVWGIGSGRDGSTVGGLVAAGCRLTGRQPKDHGQQQKHCEKNEFLHDDVSFLYYIYSELGSASPFAI